MAVPWLRILDAVIGVTDLARSRRIRQLNPADNVERGLQAGEGTLGGLETRLAGVVVAALKEAFDRDSRRLDLEREQVEAERRRAERALQLELARQAADREIGRLRLLAGVSLVSWLGTLFLAARALASGTAGRLTLGSGWILLLAGMAAASAGQSKVARALQGTGDDSIAPPRGLSSGLAGDLALWLIVGGLALAGAAMLLG
jgi:hypothetical protein